MYLPPAAHLGYFANQGAKTQGRAKIVKASIITRGR